MKILKKAKLPKVTCKLCGCMFRPEKSDLKGGLGLCHSSDMEDIKRHAFVHCPVCGLSIHPFDQDGKGNKNDSGTKI